MVNSNVEKIVPDLQYEPTVLPLAEQERLARFHAEVQERWTQRMRRRRMEEHGDPDSPLPVWPVKPPDVPLEELRRIHEVIEKEFGCLDSIRPDAL